jgi:hypothetical protein
MKSPTSKFSGVRVEVTRICADPQELLVRFTPRVPAGVRGLEDDLVVAPHPALVVVRVGSELEVVGYMPPEHNHPNITKADYERIALEAVREHLAAAHK